MATKILKRLVLVASVLATTFPVCGEPSQNSKPPANGSAVLLQQSKHTDIKRMPSGILLEVIYTDGVLTLSSDYYEGEFSLGFESLESGEVYEVPSIQVGRSTTFELGYGEYQLTAVAQDGTVLIGFMQVY